MRWNLCHLPSFPIIVQHDWDMQPCSSSRSHVTHFDRSCQCRRPIIRDRHPAARSAFPKYVVPPNSHWESPSPPPHQCTSHHAPLRSHLHPANQFICIWLAECRHACTELCKFQAMLVIAPRYLLGHHVVRDNPYGVASTSVKARACAYLRIRWTLL